MEIVNCISILVINFYIKEYILIFVEGEYSFSIIMVYIFIFKVEEFISESCTFPISFIIFLKNHDNLYLYLNRQENFF